MLTGKHLRSYLAYAVHGRKPMGQANIAQPKIRKGPPRDEAFKAWIRTLDCCACGRSAPSEAAHTGSDGGMSMKASDYSCVPLCADCHTLGAGAYHRVGKRAFERRHRLKCADVCRRLRAAWRKLAA
jgi:hypothetical protein